MCGIRGADSPNGSFVGTTELVVVVVDEDEDSLDSLSSFLKSQKLLLAIAWFR
jgi:hypothetical protein